MSKAVAWARVADHAWNESYDTFDWAVLIGAVCIGGAVHLALAQSAGQTTSAPPSPQSAAQPHYNLGSGIVCANSTSCIVQDNKSHDNVGDGIVMDNNESNEATGNETWNDGSQRRKP
jgi:parallel beta-helix repeat protein